MKLHIREIVLVLIILVATALILAASVPLQSYTGQTSNYLCNSVNIRTTPALTQTHFSVLRGESAKYQAAKHLVDPCWGDRISLYLL